MSKQHANCSPYDFNGGACAAMAGSDYRVIAADTRMSTGYNILTRVYSKIAKLADKAFLASSGFQADVRALQKHLSMRHLIYQHQHHKQMSCPAMAQLLSNTLFYKRFFPYYAFNVLGGLDNEGKGCVFTYDAVGSYEKVGYSSQGSGSKLIMPFLDNNQLIMLLARITMSKQHTNRSFYDFNGGFCKTLESLAVRCCVPEAANQTTILSMDMYHEILKRLPVQSLCRCRCVCKTWNSHIRSQQFIAAHHAAARGSQILCATTAAGFLFTYALERARLDRFLTQPHMIEGKIKQKYVLLESETYRSIMDFQFPFEFPNYKPVEILACVNGVLVLTVVTPYEGCLFHIILWNPMVHKWIFLPQPQIRPKRHLHLSGIDSLGFGYDPSSGDLRVVRLLYIRPPADDFAKGTDFFTYDADADMDECEWNERRLDCPPGFWPYMEGWPFFPGNAYCYPPKVEVCHVKERVWRRVNTCADNDKVLNTTFVGMCAQQQCYLNASVHWVARAYNNKSDHETFSTLLLAFNFESERFRSIKLPDQLAQLNPSQSHIASVSAFRGSALLISQYTIEAWEFGCCSLWLMTDYSDPASWAKLVSVQLSTDIDWVVWLNSAEDEEVLVSRKMCQLTMYDSVCQANRGIGSNKADGGLDRTVLPYAWAFKESLYLLDENLP